MEDDERNSGCAPALVVLIIYIFLGGLLLQFVWNLLAPELLEISYFQACLGVIIGEIIFWLDSKF